MSRQFSAFCLALGCSAPFLLACSSEPGGTGNSASTGNSTGGSLHSGGVTSTGGLVATGGGVSTGGSATVTTGGKPSSGGVTASGGVTTSGGITARGTGGVTTTGGVANTGGAAGGAGNGGASGGAKSSGGSPGTGGASGGGGSGGSAVGGAASKFSFFVTSYAALTKLSGSKDGFGGDLRYGETGDGAGLKGADKICATIAEAAVPGSGAKGWHAFLSTPTVNAIDRIGNGPWYDRLGRLFSASKANLIGFRPSDADGAIKNDFPNENGVNNHNPDGTGAVDNHDTLTGSGADGKLASGQNPTCDGWTNKTGNAGMPRVGHAWLRAQSMDTCTGNTLGCYGHWISSLTEAGCGAGVNLEEGTAPDPNVPTVGSGGGYGAFYCFAVTP